MLLLMLLLSLVLMLMLTKQTLPIEHGFTLFLLLLPRHFCDVHQKHLVAIVVFLIVLILVVVFGEAEITHQLLIVNDIVLPPVSETIKDVKRCSISLDVVSALLFAFFLDECTLKEVLISFVLFLKPIQNCVIYDFEISSVYEADCSTFLLNLGTMIAVLGLMWL